MKRILTATVLILAVFALIFFGQLWMITLSALSSPSSQPTSTSSWPQSAPKPHGAKLRIPIWWMTLEPPSPSSVTLLTFQ